MVIEKPFEGFLQVTGVFIGWILTLTAVCALLDWILGQ